jgi:RNA-binding protein
MPSGQLRRSLRGHGHALSPLVRVGKSGVTAAVIKQVEQALADHELIKIKIAGECPDDRFEVADQLAGQPGVNVVQVLGRVVLLYKRHPHAPRYEGRRAEAAPADAAVTGTGRARG